MPLGSIGAIFQAIAEGLTLGTQKDAEANTGEMQSRAMAEVNQQIRADAEKEVKDENLDDIRKYVAG